MFPSHYAFILTLIEFSNTNLAAVEVPWKIQRSEAHSFLKVPTRNKRSNPDCANIEGYCEHHLSSCREHYEVSREMFCRTNNTCTSTQLCYLVTPCPKHFKTGCHEKNCTSSPCQNGGVCEDKFNDYRCYRHGFTGKHSEIDINECASNPCQNRGTCKDHANGYSCSCVPGYIGINCEKDFNECESNPCQNGGTCTDHLNRYSCLCMQGYTGVNCQTDIDECGSNPCQHGGRCIDHVNRYRCLCVPGYIGLRCQTDVNECVSNPCHHGGTCKDQVNAFMCICVLGYTGVNCQTDINECASNPCANGGSCTDHVNRYTCSCVPGYIGSNCQTDFDECHSNPCMNTGSCNNLINSYRCDCTDRYEGDICQTDCRPGPADIVFIIDTSSSLETNINKSLSFITEFIKRIPIGKDDFQVGVITYNFDATVLFDLDDYTSTSDMVAKLQHIKGENGATFTSPALKKAKEMLTNKSFGSRRISNFIILLYDGLSTDSNDAVNEATIINSIGGRIITVAVGQSISYSEMLAISREQYYTFSTSVLDDMLNGILKETVPGNCTGRVKIFMKMQNKDLHKEDCYMVTESQVILLLDTNNNQTRDDYNKRLTASRRTVEQIKTYNPNAEIGMFSYSDEVEQVFNLSWSSDIDELIAAALQVRIDKATAISNTSHALKHIRESNLFNSSRNLVVLFSNAIWNNQAEIDLEIQLSKQQDIHIFGVAAGEDCNKDNLGGVLNDPSFMFYVDDDDFTSLTSLAAITKYNNCIDDIFKKRQ